MIGLLVLHDRTSLAVQAGAQCEVLLSAAVNAGEQYYSAFQFVAWAGAGAREALEAAMFQTAGEA